MCVWGGGGGAGGRRYMCVCICVYIEMLCGVYTDVCVYMCVCVYIYSDDVCALRCYVMCIFRYDVMHTLICCVMCTLSCL